ncbi:MAG: IS110 family transposase [Promethearchaeota archaeon]
MVKQKKNKSVTKLVEGEGKRKNGPIMGIDVHKDVLAYCILTETKIIIEFQIQNDFRGIDHLIALCKECHVTSVAVESTAQYHFKLVYRMLNAGIPVLVANPQQTKSTQGKKTDKFDARRIAIAHRDGRLRPSVITSEEILSLRKANRQLFKQINDATKIKQRLNQIFHQKEFQYTNLVNSKLGLKMLDLVSQRMVTATNLHSLLPPNSKRTIALDLIKALQELQTKLDEIECISFGNEITQLRLLDLTMDRQRMAYYAVAKKNPEFKRVMKLLLSIPGVGPDTAATILAEIADISYFPTPAKLAKWAGLAPRVYQSGHRKHITGRIHKGGNKYLRRAVVLACQNIYAKGHPTNPLHRFMHQKKETKESYWLALCAGARKLLVVIWHMLKKKFQWGHIAPDPEVLQTIKKVVTKKIKLFRCKLNKYQQTWEMLSGRSNEVFESIPIFENNPKILLQTLLNSV